MFIHALFVLMLSLTITLQAGPTSWLHATAVEEIVIRPATLSDLEKTLPHLALTRTSLAQFDYVSDATQKMILQSLEETYRPLIAQEIQFFKNSSCQRISLIAEHTGTVVGFFSAQAIDLPNTIFIRWIVLNQAYSKYNILKIFIKETLKIAPQTETFVFLVKAHNEGAKKYYESIGAQQFPSAPWKKYLYAGLNKEEFIPYCIDRKQFEKSIQ